MTVDLAGLADLLGLGQSVAVASIAPEEEVRRFTIPESSASGMVSWTMRRSFHPHSVARSPADRRPSPVRRFERQAMQVVAPLSLRVW